ncbi:MAG: GtrA family protein, partial [Candidatus Thermoplasmatota archaeon]|nr:GtrA family protein [Candidatus Thermoplasmatota archaeon]MCL5254050.1 GtrA family protein [Candidatus Thermoplasmatota archaeon]
VMSSITPHLRIGSISALLRRNWSRGYRYSISGFAGFLFFEAVLFTGLRLLATGSILFIDIAAAVSSTFVAFLLNEYWTFGNRVSAGAAGKSLVKRIVAFQGVNAAGNAIIISIQILLLAYLALEPLIGTLVASVVATPVDYYLSSVIVWKVGI